MQPTNK